MNTTVLLRIPEAAELLGMTAEGLRYAVRKGTAPPSALIMGRRVFRKDDLLAWLDEQFEAQN